MFAADLRNECCESRFFSSIFFSHRFFISFGFFIPSPSVPVFFANDYYYYCDLRRQTAWCFKNSIFVSCFHLWVSKPAKYCLFVYLILLIFIFFSFYFFLASCVRSNSSKRLSGEGIRFVFYYLFVFFPRSTRVDSVSCICAPANTMADTFRSGIRLTLKTRSTGKEGGGRVRFEFEMPF